MTAWKIGVAAVWFLAAATGSVQAQQATDSVLPEAATGTEVRATSPEVQAALDAKAAGVPVEAENWMIAAANPLAVEAGADVLRAGGSAADAMVAVQAVLGLVEPQSSGLGGGAFLVWYDAETETLTTLDGRETAPLAATPRLLQDLAGDPLGFFDAVVGGLSVGTPGTPALMAAAHERWGNRDWDELMAPAIALAEGGFAVSPRLAEMIAGDAERLAMIPDTAAYFMPGGQPLAEGTVLKNPEYAQTLRMLAADGIEGFMPGMWHPTLSRRCAARPIRACSARQIWRSTACANAHPSAWPIASTRSAAWVRPRRAR
jgi:gamma-glutamyltranspeptidase/glutathione hydrolase